MSKSMNSLPAVLFCTLLVFPLATSTGAGAPAPLPPGPPEKLILGFEKAELGRSPLVAPEVRRGRDCWFYLLERPDGVDFAARFEWPGETNRVWTWRCRRGEHTEGELALVAAAGPASPQKFEPTYRETEFLSRFYPDIRGGRQARLMLTTFQWLAKAAPDLRDWSGHDRLWIDARADTAAAEVRLAVEDAVLEPPVVRAYTLPAGRWVTLELDLREAVRARGLDLARIANFWLLGRAPRRTEMRLDNIRIVRGGASSAHEIWRDRSPMSLPARPRGKPAVAPLPESAKPDRRPIELAEPLVVARGSIVPCGWVTAYDNNFLFVAYSAEKEARAVCSADGGRSWKQLPAPVARNLDHGTARGCAIDDRGSGVAVSSGPGCAGLGHANPRQHLTGYTFTGSGWEARPPVILDADIRHCGSNASVVRLRRGPHRGRLWASWGEIGRAHAIGVHVKLSDDDGRTWLPWGRGALLPGSRAAAWSDGTYGYPETAVTPCGDHVACFWRHKRRSGIRWSAYDGSTWSPPAAVSPVTLDDMDGAYRATMSAVTRGEEEIFFTATGLRTVLRWDGRSWSKEPVAIEDGGMLSLAGGVVTLFTAGKVNRRWRGIQWTRRAALSYYHRTPDGRWEGPRKLTPEFTLHEYRSLAGYSVPPYAPPNFVPLAWSDHDEGAVKLLRVPVP
jgi:hypothetical protein